MFFITSCTQLMIVEVKASGAVDYCRHIMVVERDASEGVHTYARTYLFIVRTYVHKSERRPDLFSTPRFCNILTFNIATMTKELATATTSPALLLQEDANDTVTQVAVHPLVLLGILDHHTRRQEADGRVIGTLLGRRDGNKVCFCP